MTTKQKVIELAQKCGFAIHHPDELITPTQEELEAFYRAARNEALEAARKECDLLKYSGEVGPILCVNAIEALKKQ